MITRRFHTTYIPRTIIMQSSEPTQVEIVVPDVALVFRKGTIPSSSACGKYVVLCVKIAETVDEVGTLVHLKVVEMWQMNKEVITNYDIEMLLWRICRQYVDNWIFVGDTANLAEMHLYEISR